MVIYFDGGCFKDPNNKGFGQHRTICISYGIVLHCSEQAPVEANGGYTMKCSFDGMHEHIAFLEAFKLLKSRNIDYKKVSFYTDAQEIAYANLFLHTENYHPTQKKTFVDIMKKCISFLEMEAYTEEIFDCLNNSFFVKLKSHKGIVDNMRVDYLVRKHFHQAPIKPYYEYIRQFEIPFNHKDSLISLVNDNAQVNMQINKESLLCNIQKIKQNTQTTNIINEFTI